MKTVFLSIIGLALVAACWNQPVPSERVVDSGTTVPVEVEPPVESEPTTVGSSTSWHLEEHSINLAKTKRINVVSDCRGNNTLNWEVTDSESFVQPSKVAVYCGMYAERPDPDDFHGWGWTKTNWPESDACTYETRRKHGGSACDDYFRALRETQQIAAPWCRLSFIYDEPVEYSAKVVTYCVTR